MRGHLAVGHCRYSTTGGSTWENAQPTLGATAGGTVALGHNGNLTNAVALRDLVRERYGDKALRELGTNTTDTALVTALLAGDPDRSLEATALDVLPELRGAFSLVFMDEHTLYAARDRHGIRPLVLGRLERGWVVASETAALDIVGASVIREVEPGELIAIDADGLRTSRFAAAEPKGCVFEYVYLARPDTTIAGRVVHEARVEMGRQLASQHPVDADLVIPTPESGTPAAIGYAQQSGIPYGQGLVKNSYVGRTFIEPSQTIRQLGIRLKLNPLREVIRGKRLVVVDDSIVRGNTQRALVRMLREAGAAEVHVRISSPPVTWPCFYGIDFASRAELIATGLVGRGGPGQHRRRQPRLPQRGRHGRGHPAARPTSSARPASPASTRCRCPTSTGSASTSWRRCPASGRRCRRPARPQRGHPAAGRRRGRDDGGLGRRRGRAQPPVSGRPVSRLRRPAPAGLTYAAAGVDVEAGDRAVALMKALGGQDPGHRGPRRHRRVRRPVRRQRLTSYAPSGAGHQHRRGRAPRSRSPSSWTCTTPIGFDLVGMVVDDIVVCGAEPLFMTDYIACGQVVPERIAAIVKGIAEACVVAGCALVGGETAEHPGLLEPDEYDVAGAATGVVERDELLGPQRVRAGDVVVAMASSGLHSNGYSLVRRVFGAAGWGLDRDVPELGRTLGEELLTPTRVYAADVLDLVRAGPRACTR